jgi:hypothetical protein
MSMLVLSRIELSRGGTGGTCLDSLALGFGAITDVRNTMLDR